jgi:hypothetical protein
VVRDRATAGQRKDRRLTVFRARQRTPELHIHPERGDVHKWTVPSRIAMMAEIPALRFSSRDQVTRVIRKRAAARETLVSPRYSRRTKPGLRRRVHTHERLFRGSP